MDRHLPLSVVLFVTAIVVGAVEHIKGLYVLVAAVALVGFGLWTLNQFSIRRGLKTTPSGGVDLTAAEDSASNALSVAVSHKQTATANELAQPTITNRLVRIADVPVESDGFIRQKTFIDCDIVGPAIIYPKRVDFSRITFGVSSNTIESILWPPNPEAPMAVGIIGLDMCRFDRGQFINLGFTGNPENLDLFRQLRVVLVLK